MTNEDLTSQLNPTRISGFLMEFLAVSFAVFPAVKYEIDMSQTWFNIKQLISKSSFVLVLGIASIQLQNNKYVGRKMLDLRNWRYFNAVNVFLKTTHLALWGATVHSSFEVRHMMSVKFANRLSKYNFFFSPLLIVGSLHKNHFHFFGEACISQKLCSNIWRDPLTQAP